MKREKQPKAEEQVYSDTERRPVVAAEAKPKTSAATNTLILVVLLAALGVSAYLNRAHRRALAAGDR